MIRSTFGARRLDAAARFAMLFKPPNFLKEHSMNARIFDRLALVARVNPASVAPGTADSDAVDMSGFRRALFALAAGAIGAGGSVDFTLQSAAAPGGPFSDVPGKAIATLTQAGGGSNQQALIEIRADELPDGARYVRGRVTIATAASLVAVIALAGEPRFAPVDGQDLASVAQTIG